MEFKKPFSLRAGDVQIYCVCEDLTECLIYAMAIFSPWALGTTQTWSIWCMNIAGFFLGTLLAVKWFIRYLKGYSAPRWGGPGGEALTLGLLVMTLVILFFCFTSAVNALDLD